MGFSVVFQAGHVRDAEHGRSVAVSLSVTPLTEEYSVAAQVWKLGPQDVCEIARNSVYISDFNHECKLAWLGPDYRKYGAEGNDPYRTNVPNVRLMFRSENLQNEIRFLLQGQQASQYEGEDM